MRYSKCVSCSRSIGLIGLIVNAILMIMKGFIGVISGSQALIADAMYSAKDVVTSFLVIVGLNISSRPLDREHPYGHGKIEFILSLVISIVFLGLTGYLFIHAVETLLDDSAHRTPHIIALWAALVSIAVNVGMYFYSRCVHIEGNSPMVKTLSKHHHADATASGAVALGIIGAHYLNMPWIDTAIALVETVHLFYLGLDVFRDSVRGLMDKSASDEMRWKIGRVAESVDGVEKVNSLRARHIGQEVFVEVAIGVSSDISVKEANTIVNNVQQRVLNDIPHIGSVQVRFETYYQEEHTESYVSADSITVLEDTSPDSKREDG